MRYTARNVKPGGKVPEAYRKEHGLSESAHWAYDQKTSPETTSKPRQRVSSGYRNKRYGNQFNSISMPRDLHGFAEKAIELAGQAGERKRQSQAQASRNLAQTRMAEIEEREAGRTERQRLSATSRLAGIERQQVGATERQRLSEAGRMAEIERQQVGATRRQYISDAGRMARAAAAEAGTEKRHLRQYGPEGIAGQKLSYAMEEKDRERKDEQFGRFVEGAFAKYAKREKDIETGETRTTMPDWVHRRRAEAMALEPEKREEYINSAIEKHEWIESERARLANMSRAQLEAELEELEAEEANQRLRDYR